MNAPLRITGFIVTLAAVFAIALVAGRGVGPIGDGPMPETNTTQHG